jgi:aminoglycoside 6'-N-acetyltransferase I
MHDAEQPIIIRHLTSSDGSVWESMRRALWPDGAEDRAPEIAQFFAGTLQEPVAVIMAETADAAIVGFAELSIRLDLPGFEARPVGYVEGLYVPLEFRHRGVARKLMRASRDWARRQSCVAFASDRAGRLVFDATFSSADSTA